MSTILFGTQYPLSLFLGTSIVKNMWVGDALVWVKFPSDDIIAYYKMDESSGTVYDSIGSNDMTAYDVSYSQTGKINTGIGFSTSGAGMEASVSGLNPTTDVYTVSAWVNLSTLPSTSEHNYDIFRGTINSTPWENIELSVTTDNKFLLSILDSSDNFGCSHTAEISTGTWYHVVAIANGIGNKSTLYVNNSSVSGTTSQASNIRDADNMYYVGNDYVSGPDNFMGVIDEIGIWDRALSANEVSALYNNGNGLIIPMLL